ncbi:magnesium transporter [Vibrio sp. 188UL20-2]|uniref:Magnesium transporter n=1 Tax=Vibrio ulleungensis TaxID=2807619 RepID=A0ABS2HCH0_9VIBR|nr:magnesium transporter [Vibrio ulleungensis]MBM7035290.1 magnesium transporter [Vibrio ulleungensis]
MFASLLLFLSYILSKLGRVHGTDLPEEHFINGYPSIIQLIDSQYFLGAIACATILITIYVLSLFWKLHEIAVHKAQSMASAHTQIVFALSLCGLFIDKMWWVLAIIVAFTRWDLVSRSFSQIISTGINPNKEPQGHTQPEPKL